MNLATLVALAVEERALVLPTAGVITGTGGEGGAGLPGGLPQSEIVTTRGVDCPCGCLRTSSQAGLTDGDGGPPPGVCVAAVGSDPTTVKGIPLLTSSVEDTAMG
mmetsp:Transcript_13805/g.32439  ORF Transcript_13805/g.32439 Transcript_13805/m.32439 type:complete len:105 (+) Transcript_13805:415-729(+)